MGKALGSDSSGKDGALATHKQWKIDNGYGNKDTYDTLRGKFIKDNPNTATIIDLIKPDNN